MQLSRQHIAMTLLSGAMILAAAGAAEAQERRLFEWNGRVDREVQIAMRGREIWIRGVGGTDDPRERPRVRESLPRSTRGHVLVELEDGRGDADVIQQPTARNDYTTIVRIRDRFSGDDRYRVRAYWDTEDDRDWPGRGRGDVYDRNPGDRGVGRGNGTGGGYPGGIDTRPRIEDRAPGGYGTSSLRWTGSVDAEVEIRIQGNSVQARTLSGNLVRDVHSDFSRGALPQRDALVEVVPREGRGQVWVVQQPSSRNGWTAIVRVRDPQSGYGRYVFDLNWR